MYWYEPTDISISRKINLCRCCLPLPDPFPASWQSSFPLGFIPLWAYLSSLCLAHESFNARRQTDGTKTKKKLIFSHLILIC